MPCLKSSSRMRSARDDFARPKIVYPNMTKFLPFYYDEKGFLTNQKCFILTGEKLAFLTAFLNSSIFKFCFKNDFPELLGDTRELSKIFFDQIPVMMVSSTINDSFAEMINAIQQSYTEELAERIDNALYDLYGLAEDEKNVIRSAQSL